MASIIINEIDNTVLNPEVDSSDNIVYVPGNAITGPSGVPTLLKNYEEFTRTFGENAPAADSDEVGTSWDYAANLLQTGEFYVLFERVMPLNNDVPAAAQASADITIFKDEQSLVVGKVKELYGGTFGNRLAYTIIKTSTDIRFRTMKKVYTEYVMLEDIKLVSIGTKTPEQIKAELKDLIGAGLSTDYVEISITDMENFDLPNVTNEPLSGGTDATDSAVALAVPAVYDKLKDKFIYDVKFVTSANFYNTGEGVSEVNYVRPMQMLAEARQDCTVFANIPISLDKADVQDWIRMNSTSSYVTFFAPWSYTSLSIGGKKWMAPSYVALNVLAKDLKLGYKIYQAPAGVNRGRATIVDKPEYEIGSVTLDAWQNTKAPYVNPIMYLLRYGYTIFGQRTAYMVNGSEYDKSSLQELSVRLTANEIKRKIRSICLGLSFEGNNIRTWNSFRGQLIPYLADMKAYGGLEDFRVIMDETTTTPDDINRNRIRGNVDVVITRAAEDFVINFTLEPAGTTFEEVAE